jgi:hypothetical protein
MMTLLSLDPSRAAALQRIRQAFADLKADLYAYCFTGRVLSPSAQAVALHAKIEAAMPELTAPEKALLAAALLRPTEYYNAGSIPGCAP